MHVQVVYKPRHFSYDQDWLDAFARYMDAELVSEAKTLNADLIILHHSITGQVESYEPWLKKQLLNRRGKLVVFHTNEFKMVWEREKAALDIHADYIATQLPDGRLYRKVKTICMPHALNPDAFYDMRLDRSIPVGFRGSSYKHKVNDDRNAIIKAFSRVSGSDILLDSRKMLNRKEWATFLNMCKAIPGAEAGSKNARIISPRHLEAVGTKTLQILLEGDYCGVLSREHYLPYTTVEEAMDVVMDARKRTEITERAFQHVIENHTYKHRINALKRVLCSS